MNNYEGLLKKVKSAIGCNMRKKKKDYIHSYLIFPPCDGNSKGVFINCCPYFVPLCTYTQVLWAHKQRGTR